MVTVMLLAGCGGRRVSEKKPTLTAPTRSSRTGSGIAGTIVASNVRYVGAGMIDAKLARADQ